MGRRRPVQKGLGLGEVKGSDVPLNVPLPPSKVPLKVEFVVLSILEVVVGCGYLLSMRCLCLAIWCQVFV